MNRYSIIFLSICCYLFSFGITFAQGLPVSNGLELSLSTDNPTPGQIVTITARSFSADISGATITWLVNEKQEQKGLGVTTLDVTAPALGKKLTINVSAITTAGRSFTNSIVILSGSVDMIIESGGYVPPFFKGKIPLVYQNNFTVTAIPHIANSAGVEYDPKTLIYSWNKNGQVIEGQSGYGKQSIQLVGDLVPRDYTLTVIVSPRDGGTQVTGRILIPFVAPTISFYVNDPLYGPLFNRAINGNVRIGSERETGVLAVPFGFNKPTNSLGDLTFSWLINGMQQTELSMKESIVLRAPDNSTGSSNISLGVKNSKQFLQGANSNFTASFSASPSQTPTGSVTF